MSERCLWGVGTPDWCIRTDTSLHEGLFALCPQHLTSFANASALSEPARQAYEALMQYLANARQSGGIIVVISPNDTA